MLCEGICLTIKTSALSIRLHGKRKKHQNLAYMCIGWGVPFVIVLISASVTMPLKQYMDRLTSDPDSYRVCWVGTEDNTVLYSVIIPFAVVIAVNLIILSRSGFFVYEMSKATERMKPQQTDREASHVLNSLKAVGTLLPALGLAWVFALLISKLEYASNEI